MNDDKQGFEKQGLPFRLFDSVLGRMKKLVDSGTDVARQSVRRDAATHAEASANARAASPSEASIDEADAGDVGETQILTTPTPSKTATAAPALATALDEEARAAIAKHAGEDDGGAVTDGLALEDQSGRVPPDEELGPEPFKPQVGP